MFAVVVSFKIHPGKTQEFLGHMRVNAQSSLRDEPGCHKFDVCTDPSRPDEVFLYELYTDEAAFGVHQTMPHYTVMGKAAAGLVADRDLRTYSVVEP
jgi:quinol monooxygenase YgiN